MTAHTHIAGDVGRKGGGSSAHDGGKQGTPDALASSSGQNKCYPSETKQRKSEMSPTKATTDAEPPLPPIRRCRRHCLFRWLTECCCCCAHNCVVLYLYLTRPRQRRNYAKKKGMMIDHIGSCKGFCFVVPDWQTLASISFSRTKSITVFVCF